MKGCPDPLVAVGRDCDCGHPLVWMDGEQRCAVYGTHLPPGAQPSFANLKPGQPVGFRNRNAPGSSLIDLSLALTFPRKRSAA